MPSPRPTRLQPDDRVWWADGPPHSTGTVIHVDEDGQMLSARPDHNPRAVVFGGAASFHPLYDLEPDVLGVAEVCKLLDITQQRLHQLRQRVDFPRARQLAIGDVWDTAAIKAWDQDRKNQRDGARTRVLASYRKLGSIYAVARSTGIPYTTCRRYLLAAGAIQPTDHQDTP